MPSILPVRPYRSRRNIFRPAPRRNVRAMKRALRSSMSPATRKLNASSIYKFSRYAAPLSMITNTTQVQSIPWTQQFQLTDVVNYTDFTTLFDNYKIDKVVYQMQLLTNPEAFVDITPSLTNKGVEHWYPVMWYVMDNDDSAVPTLAQLREKQGIKRKVLKPNQIISFTVYPKFQKQTYAGPGGLVGYGPASGWLDCADAGVPHYGIKGCVDFHQNLNTLQYNIEVTAKYYLSFKGAQ